METTAFAAGYRIPFPFPCGSQPLPPVRAVANSLSFSFIISENLKTNNSLSSSRKYHNEASARKRTKTSSLAAMRITCGAIREINENEFSDVVLKSNRPVLVEFVATWCGPCRLIGPAMESIAQEYEGKLAIFKIDHDSNPRLIEEYKVYGLPTLILFKNGEEIPDSKREGAITKVKLKEYIDRHLESLSIA